MVVGGKPQRCTDQKVDGGADDEDLSQCSGRYLSERDESSPIVGVAWCGG